MCESLVVYSFALRITKFTYNYTPAGDYIDNRFTEHANVYMSCW